MEVKIAGRRMRCFTGINSGTSTGFSYIPGHRFIDAEKLLRNLEMMR